ncbi:hypothetical protein JOQ06_021798 [Pogonophryne albipinna]|uniref:MHD domain-containing protein n=1 Tax=Pogonophryne albipinna TaxID=1090488 RepID=A0AAD6A5H7_9TELE|nr:hypothetical protein JOQ06_021798 [Pogonophryne albipinna]
MSLELSSPDQSAELKLQTRSIEWTIPRFPGGTQLSALRNPPVQIAPLQTFILTSISSLSLVCPPPPPPPQVEVPGLSPSSLMEVGPMVLNFELPKLTVSGLQVRFLRLSPVQPGPAQRWVRYVTHSDSYILRI